MGITSRDVSGSSGARLRVARPWPSLVPRRSLWPRARATPSPSPRRSLPPSIRVLAPTRLPPRMRGLRRPTCFKPTSATTFTSILRGCCPGNRSIRRQAARPWAASHSPSFGASSQQTQRLRTTLRRLGLPVPSPRVTQSAERTPGGATKAQAKALGLIADDLTNDGDDNLWRRKPVQRPPGPVAAGTFDFQGIAAHELTEVMGRLGLMGATIGSFGNSYDLADLFTVQRVRCYAPSCPCPSNDNWFSIDNGTTLLKRKNDYCANGSLIQKTGHREQTTRSTSSVFLRRSRTSCHWWICGKWTCSGTTVWLRRLNRRRLFCLPQECLPPSAAGVRRRRKRSS